MSDSATCFAVITLEEVIAAMRLSGLPIVETTFPRAPKAPERYISEAMPIYEFYSPDTNRIYSFFARSVAQGQLSRVVRMIQPRGWSG